MRKHQAQKGKSVDWLTPPEWIKALGPFDLDPCCPEKMPWKTAKVMLTKKQDGLHADWRGKRLWLNPPFGREADEWLSKMLFNTGGIALLPANTETERFRNYVWGHSDGVCFPIGRPHFYTPNGKKAKSNSGCSICLIAYGSENLAALLKANLGPVVTTINR